MRKIIGLFVLLAVIAQPARADDPAAGFVIQLFSKACIDGSAAPDKVKAYAKKLNLYEVDDPAALDVFVGKVENGASIGAAWAANTEVGKFVLSIRGKTGACAVWAEAAAPAEVEDQFKAIMKGVMRPGMSVTVFSDKYEESPHGEAHNLAYRVAPEGSKQGFLFTLQTAQKSGGPFQVSLQQAVFTEK